MAVQRIFLVTLFGRHQKELPATFRWRNPGPDQEKA